MKTMYNSKKGEFSAKMGMDIAFGSIFILAIGLTVAQSTIDTLNLTGIDATVASYIPLIIIAGFLYGVARLSGIL